MYKNIKIDQDALNSLPQHGIPCDISKLETNSKVDQNLNLSESNSDSDSDAESNVVTRKTPKQVVFFLFNKMKNTNMRLLKIN